MRCVVFVLSLISVGGVAGPFAYGLQEEVVAVDEAALTLFSRDLQISAETPGLLKGLEVTEGDVVGQGDLLGNLDWREAKLRLELATHRHAAALKRRDSTVELRLATEALHFAERIKVRNDQLPKEAVSETERDQIHFEYQRSYLSKEQAEETLILSGIEVDVLQTEMLVAEHQLNIQSIRSPINGVVVVIYKRPGEYVQAGEPILRLIKNDVMRVSALVSLEDAERIKRGVAVRFTTQSKEPHSGPGRSYLGRVIAVSPENQREDRSSVSVLAEIENPERVLKANVSGRLEIFTR